MNVQADIYECMGVYIFIYTLHAAPDIAASPAAGTSLVAAVAPSKGAAIGS